MEDKIKLLLAYMKKEKELMYEVDKEEGVDINDKDYKVNYLATVGRVKSFIGYRNIRIEEAWFNKLNKCDNQDMVKKSYEYEEERSRRHMVALDSMIGMNEFSKIYSLPKFYDGELITGTDIYNYRNIDIRKKETDFFLQFVDKLSRTPGIVIKKYMEELNIEETGEELEFMQELQKNIDIIDDKYGVRKSLTEDDGDIKFKDDYTFPDFDR